MAKDSGVYGSPEGWKREKKDNKYKENLRDKSGAKEFRIKLGLWRELLTAEKEAERLVGMWVKRFNEVSRVEASTVVVVTDFTDERSCRIYLSGVGVAIEAESFIQLYNKLEGLSRVAHG